MRLLRFRNTAYRFSLSFADGRTLLVDLRPLIGAQVSKDDLATARIDADWGCLEFRDGAVDIDPATLYRYALDHRESEAA